MSEYKDRLSSFARRWAIGLTAQQSVTGTKGEAAFGPWLVEALRNEPALGGAQVWTIPVQAGDARQCVAMLIKGAGRKTVLLTGHYDTVSVEDYGPLEALATQPPRLTEALRQSLTERAETPAERRAKEDFAGDDFLAGRGLLDMKAGLAAGLAVCAEFAGEDGRTGNLLFMAVPDEENNSAGARRTARALPEIVDEHGLDIIAAINLDAIADDHDGTDGRVIALGTVGKLLPTAYVAGVPAHSGFPLNGINAGALAAAVAARVEWSAELTDDSVGQPGTPPSLLAIRDGKTGYDVTTPASAFVTFNVLSHRRKPEEVLERFDALCRDTAASHLAELSRRIADRGGAASARAETIPVYRYEAVREHAISRGPGAASALDVLGATLASGGLSLPEQCRVMTDKAWLLSGLSGPAIVTGFGSMPYLPTNLSDAPDAARLLTAAQEIASEAEDRYGVAVRCTDYFSGISDMSFLGEADEADLAIVARNTPMWRDGVRWPDRHGIANIPTINVGPWGRDYHTPLERLHVGYAFDVLPRLLVDLVGALLA